MTRTDSKTFYDDCYTTWILVSILFRIFRWNPEHQSTDEPVQFPEVAEIAAQIFMDPQFSFKEKQPRLARLGTESCNSQNWSSPSILSSNLENPAGAKHRRWSFQRTGFQANEWPRRVMNWDACRRQSSDQLQPLNATDASRCSNSGIHDSFDLLSWGLYVGTLRTCSLMFQVLVLICHFYIVQHGPRPWHELLIARSPVAWRSTLREDRSLSSR